jgi:Tfp pilus assembly protein PilO
MAEEMEALKKELDDVKKRLDTMFIQLKVTGCLNRWINPKIIRAS